MELGQCVFSLVGKFTGTRPELDAILKCALGNLEIVTPQRRFFLIKLNHEEDSVNMLSEGP